MKSITKQFGDYQDLGIEAVGTDVPVTVDKTRSKI